MMKNLIKELKTFIFLWSIQSLSQLGSTMTNFALTLWLYEKTGSALQTAMLSICSYEMRSASFFEIWKCYENNRVNEIDTTK